MTWTCSTYIEANSSFRTTLIYTIVYIWWDTRFEGESILTKYVPLPINFVPIIDTYLDIIFICIICGLNALVHEAGEIVGHVNVKADSAQNMP